jgi:hypothetical protein
VAVNLPSASAECTTTVQPAQPGASPQQFGYKTARAADGKTRTDYGATSVITDPKAGKMMLLDHVKKEVRTLPIPDGPPEPPKPPEAALPGAPKPPDPPPVPGMTVKDLGKRLVEGHEVEGKQFTLPPPPKAPEKPEMPKPPEIPKLPDLPGMPKPPELAKPEPPKPPEVPTVTEVWTSTKLQIPVLTRITGPFGKQTCHCKNLSGAEPPASLFEIPKDYRKA